MKKKLTMLLASLFLVMGTAWAQVVEGQAYFLKVVGVDNTYIDAKTNKGGNRGGTIGVSSVKVPVYFQKDGNNWKISTDATLTGGFLKVNQWDVNPQKTEGTAWTIESAGDGVYRLKQGDFTTSDGPYLGCENLTATVNLYSNRPIEQAVKIQFEEAYKIELTTDENNPKWYTIKNVRGNAYAYYNGNSTAMGMSGVIDKAAYFFYFTEGSTPGTYKIHNSVNSNLCGAPNSWTAEGIDWYIQLSANASYPGFAISKESTLTTKGSEAWNDFQNSHTSVAWYGGNDDGSTWEISRYEYESILPTVQLSTEGNIVLHYIRSQRRDSYVNFDGHNSTFKEGAQGLASYWYFVQDEEAQKSAPEGLLACRIYNAAHATGVENHSSGYMGDSSYPAKIYYIGTGEKNRNGYFIRYSTNTTNGWHDYGGTHVGDYKLDDDGSYWRIYPAGKTGAELISEATTAKTNALSTIALYESADYYTYSDDAIATAKTAIEAVNTAELHSAVAGLTSIPAAVTALQATEKGTAGPAVGDYIRFKNKAKGVYMAATENDNDMIRKSADKTDLKTLWLVEAGENGSVKLKNVGTQKYIGAIAKSADVKQKESAEASQFTFTNVADVYGAFQTTGGGDYAFANMNEWWGTFKVVGWEKNDAASQWVMTQAYPLTVVYKLGEEELTDLRVEEIVEPGTVYTIENTDEFINDFREIKSCVVNGNEITADAGVWTVTVNGATTVTVTLSAPEITTRPYYALKSVTGTYLGLTAKAEGLVTDGVYTIQGDANGIRGYMAAGEGYADYPILSEITYSGCQGNSVTAIENGKNWYVYTTAVGTYIYNIGAGKFLAQELNVINLSDTPYPWNIVQNGTYTSIYDNTMAKYLSMGCGRTAANRPVAWDTNKDDGGAQHTFTAVSGDYSTQIAAAQAAIAKVSFSFQNTPLYLYYTPTADGAVFEYKDEAGKYLGYEESGWNVVTDRSVWTIKEANGEGFSHIVRSTDDTKYLGSDANTNVGTGLYSNVGSNCNQWAFEGLFKDYPTGATTIEGKRHFTSEKLFYAGACNVLRFTLTDSDAKYKNGKNRMSFDSFELYDIYGKKVELTEDCFDGNYNKSYAGFLDGLNAGAEGAGCCCGAWDSPDAGNDWFEITLPNNVDLGGAFSFSFVTENTTMNAKAFDIAMRYENTNYALNIVAPYGQTVTVTYNGEAVANGDVIVGDFDEALLEVVDIENFAYTVTVDEEKHLVTIEFVQTGAIVNPASVVALVNRIGGTGTANSFKFVHDPELDGETFVIGAEDGKILIKGTTISAITTGLGWYLNNIAHINIAWNSLNEKTTTVKWDANAGYADLSHLPIPTTEETHTSDAQYRYYLNTCTFGYSMTSWTWTRWQQEIDWMALHGINMPLQLVGLEEVWRTFLTMEDGNGRRKYGYTDEEAKAFVAGPAFIAWWAMNNLEGWGGTAAGSKSGFNNLAGAGGVQDDAWYARQKELAGKIVDAQRALGMQPVIPGWSGMVPTNFASKSGFATRGNGGNWAGDFVRPLLLSVSNANYAEIAADYYECLHAVMGESQYYSMDPFHEGGGAGTMEDYEALYAAMEAANPGSQWVIQQWQWSATQKYSLTAVPAGRLIVLDLFSDGSPAFDGYNGYAPQEAVFCAIPNFGGRSGLMGRLQNVTDNYFKFKDKHNSIKGIGTAPEAIEQTPVTYDLIYQLPWMNGVKPDVAAWVDNYAVARYGKDNAVVKEAWSLLRQGPLNYGADGIQGPVEDVWAARPNLDANKASSWGKTLADAGGTYTPARRQMLIDAVYKLIDQEDELALTAGSVYESNYLYDLVEFGGAVMADYAYDLLLGIKAAKNVAGANFATDATYIARRDAFLQLILDMDAFRGTNLNFRLGKWTQEARDAAGEVTGATTATPDWYEYNNARTILSTWSSPGTNLTDYSYRSWQGLLKDYYYKRWKYYFDNNCTNGEYKYFEWNWAHGKEHYVGQTGISKVDLTEEQDGHTSKYTREPVGNTVEEAVKMLGKYIIPVAMADGTHYAYRYLTNDLSSKVTIVVTGNSIDLTQYFGALEGATVTGNFIEGTATDLANIPLKANLDGAYTGTITLADGTVLTFGVSANPKYNGAYQIKYSGEPVFIQYHNVGDNAGNVGYKVVTTKKGNGGSTGYKADYEADKIFTITPSGVGYTLSAQGQYLKTTASSGWNHIMFSDQKGDAGTYVFNETADLVKLKSTNASGMPHVAIFDNGAWGNDVENKAIGFTIEEVENYAITITSAGMATLCLPFNVVMADGMYAYDLSRANIETEGDKYACTMKAVAAPGETLKKGTPVIIQAKKGEYKLAITMDDTDAKGTLEGSLLKGNFVSQALTQSETTPKLFIFANGEAGVGFYLLDTTQGATIGANKCWLEWDMTLGQVANSISLRFGDDTTDVEHIETIRPTQLVIYNIMGQRLDAPQKGINIINGKKVLIK